MKNLRDTNPQRYQVAAMCRLFGKTKQAYYKPHNEPFALSPEKEMEVVVFCESERNIDPGIGCRKLWQIFVKEHWPVSRRVFEDVLRTYGKMLKIRRRSVRTTNSMHGMPVYPNLVYSLIPQRPCEVWVSDITYITLHNADDTTRFCFLSVVMDAYSRYILGYYVGRSLETVYSTIALNMALENNARMGLDISNLIHHSDRGVQYASSEYVNVLKNNQISISMTEDGNPKDNPQAERINSTIKNELLKDMKFSSIEQVQKTLSVRVPYYNHRRPHMSLNGMTPIEAIRQRGPITKQWKSHRDAAIAALSSAKEKKN